MTCLLFYYTVLSIIALSSCHPIFAVRRIHLCPYSATSDDNALCQATSCAKDSECIDRHKCCFNGCINSCSKTVSDRTPPAFDWIGPVGPVPETITTTTSLPLNILLYENTECSTTYISEDDVPLDCPQGFRCIIEDFGDRFMAIPNRGYCAFIN